MVNLRRFAVRANARRRSVRVFPRAAEVCESRALLSAVTPEALAAAGEAAAEEEAGEAAGEATADGDTATAAQGGVVSEGGDTSGGEPAQAAETEQGPRFESLEFRIEAGNRLVVSGTVSSSTGSETVTFGGMFDATVTCDANGNFTYSIHFSTGLGASVTATATDLNNNDSDTQILNII